MCCLGRAFLITVCFQELAERQAELAKQRVAEEKHREKALAAKRAADAVPFGKGFAVHLLSKSAGDLDTDDDESDEKDDSKSVRLARVTACSNGC